MRKRRGYRGLAKLRSVLLETRNAKGKEKTATRQALKGKRILVEYP
jgi:hypothetical protein